MPLDYLHNHREFSELIGIVARERRIDRSLVEKDYWLMHVLYGLQKLGRQFELKGGTSLSKGFGIIHRFSEDLDLCIHPKEGEDVPTGPNQNSSTQIEKRKVFFDRLTRELGIDGITNVVCDTQFDDIPRYRSCGIRLHYPRTGEPVEGISESILLEPGFARTAPNAPKDISSWAYDYAVSVSKVEITDNRASGIPCYEPQYTFVEKLQTISTKFIKQQKDGTSPAAILRHYYDVYCLLKRSEVQAFIGTAPYLEYKKKKFGKGSNFIIHENAAFSLPDPDVRKQYEEAYQRTSALYYQRRPSFAEILDEIAANAIRL